MGERYFQYGELIFFLYCANCGNPLREHGEEGKDKYFEFEDGIPKIYVPLCSVCTGELQKLRQAVVIAANSLEAENKD